MFSPFDADALADVTRISDTVAHHAAHTPHAIATVFKAQRLTYSELDALVERCSRMLIAMGVGHGDRVAHLGTSRPEFLVSFLATCRIGAVWQGLNPKYQRDELAYVVGDARPRVILAFRTVEGRDFTDDMEHIAAETGSVDRLAFIDGEGAAALDSFTALLGEGDAVPDDLLRSRADAVEPDDAALIVYTSGSSGRPKGALLSHRGLVTCTKVQNDRWFTEHGRVLCNFPINHIACVGDICSTVLMGGGTLYFMEAFDPGATLEITSRERLTALGGVPVMLQMMAMTPEFRQADLSSVEYIIWSGAAAPEPLLEVLAGLDVTLATSYGMTETVGSVTYTDLDAGLEVLANTIGKPDPRYEVKVMRSDGTESDVGEEGEIWVRGDCRMLGYFEREDATRETIDANGWLHTGDVAVTREDGNLSIVGRLSEMYKSGGYNVYPREIEMVLEDYEGVVLAAVVGVPDPLYREVGNAFIQAVPGVALDPEDLRAYCRTRLANYKVPKRFEVIDEMPFLPVGKIDKLQLRETARAHVTETEGA